MEKLKTHVILFFAIIICFFYLLLVPIINLINKITRKNNPKIFHAEMTDTFDQLRMYDD